MNGTIVDVPVGGSFEFGYHIMDRDTGRCRDSDDNGCNDLVCEAFSSIYEDTYSELDRVHEGALTSDNGRCRVTYQWGPALDSPVGTGVEGAEPLPWLSMTDFYVNAASGEVEIELRNTGTATWPWKDLVIELQTRSGDSLGFYTWPGFVLETGETVTLRHPEMFLSEPFDACVVIDPFDDVPEGPERTGAMFHNPICPQLPDLIITDAYYDPAGGGRVRVTVQNTGSGPLENRTVGFETRLPNGTPLYIGGSYPGVNFASGDIRTFDLGGVSETIRERMAAGYVVTVNPEESILESNLENNGFTIGEATRLRIYWSYINAPSSVGDFVEFHLDAKVGLEHTLRQIANWDLNAEIDWNSCDPRCWKSFNHHETDELYDTAWFDIYGDEVLEVEVRITHPGSLYENYSRREIFTAPGWGGGGLDPENSCRYFPTREVGDHRWRFDTSGGAHWAIRFDICRENFEE